MGQARQKIRGVAATLSAGLLLSLTACAPESGFSDDAFVIYATTGYLADAASVIDPGAEIITMVGPGADPHTYQASTRDIQSMQAATLVLWNGLGLEAQLLSILPTFGDRQLAVGDQIDRSRLLPWDDGLYDPHIWNSPDIWADVVFMIATKFAELKPERASEYTANAETFAAEIRQAGQEAAEVLAAIPAGSRTLITGHDAFNYFGHSFDLEVRATDFVSTEAVLSPQELSELAQLIAEREIPVIFQDNQANPQAIKSLRDAVHSLGWEVEISEHELYADTLGAEPGVDSYLGVFRHNLAAIAEALVPTDGAHFDEKEDHP